MKIAKCKSQNRLRDLRQRPHAPSGFRSSFSPTLHFPICTLHFAMKKPGKNLLWLILAFFLHPQQAFGFCHELEVVQARFVRVAAVSNAPVLIEWFGHSTFQITSSMGTRMLTDPHGRDGLPWPSLPQDIVTSIHPHGPHSSIWMAKGNPVILEGLTPGGESWRNIHTSIRDV